jgi:hypothetical protein
MHAAPHWDRGSRKRLAKIKLRRNWPRPLPMIITTAAIVLLWLLHSWLHAVHDRVP